MVLPKTIPLGRVNRRMTMRNIHTPTWLAVGILAVVALWMLPSAASAQPMTPITISITNNGIVSDATQPLGGLYLVTVRNDSSSSRGVVLKGIDRGPSPYIRFSRVLAPGERYTFRWYFPADRTVQLRDLLRCEHARRTYMLAGFGRMTSSLVFG